MAAMTSQEKVLTIGFERAYHLGPSPAILGLVYSSSVSCPSSTCQLCPLPPLEKEAPQSPALLTAAFFASVDGSKAKLSWVILIERMQRLPSPAGFWEPRWVL